MRMGKLRMIQFEIEEIEGIEGIEGIEEEGDDPPRCVRWILGQPPRKRAEALGLCEGVWGLAHSSGEEMHKMQSLRASLLREFEERRSGDLADIEMLRRQLEESRGERLKLVEGMQASVG